MPTDDGIRLDDKQMAPPVRADPGEKDPKRTLLAGAKARDAGAQE
jgi:hypothetical protein